VHIEIEYFGGARELTGQRQETLVLQPPDAGLPALVALLAERHPRLSPLLSRVRLAVNDEFVDATATLQDGDRVAVMPPVAGGSSDTGDTPEAIAQCEVRQTPLSVDDALAAVQHPGAGAVTFFVGVVRDHADGKPVKRLDYEAHDTLAVAEMRRVLEGVVGEHPDVRLAVQHRTGQLAIGDAAVVIAASSPHRGDAFSACRKAIDRIKETVPIWKHEWAPDGSANWVNLDGE